MSKATTDEIEIEPVRYGQFESFRHGAVDSTRERRVATVSDLPTGSRFGLEHRHIVELYR